MALRWNEFLLRSTFWLSGILYVLLFIGYFFWINLFRSSFNVISISAILVPFAIFLLFGWILWKHKYSRVMGKGKKAFVIITILGVVLPLYCFVLLGINEFRYNFTVENWAKSTEERVYMVDDLLNDYELKGKTKEEVSELLGKPTQNAYFKEKNNSVYWLGIERGFIRIDSEWLVVSFNSNGKVTKYEIRTD